MTLQLLDRIERHLETAGIAPTRFGRDFAHDPRLVLDLRAGRRPRRQLAHRLMIYLDARESLPPSSPRSLPGSRRA